LEEYPNRHRNHEIETLSERFFKNCFPVSWIINSFQIDYGTDYNCEITIDKKVIGNNFSIQLKGKETEPDTENVKVTLKRSTINRWLNKLEPTMIIVFIVDENEAFWTWFTSDTVDLTLKNENFTISIPRHNKLSETDWNLVSSYVGDIFSRKHLLFAEPKLDDHNEIAWKAFFENKFEKALSNFYQLIKENPENASMLEAIALSEYYLFNYQKALININKALIIKNDVSFKLNKASILTEQGALNKDDSKILEAIDIYETLIKCNHISYSLFYNYGSALIKLNKYEKSINYFKKAIYLDSNKPEAWNNLGNSYMNLGQHYLEIECYNNALQIAPNSGETLFSKGSSLFRHFGKVEEGLSLMLQATGKTDRYEIDNPYVFFWIAEAYLTKKDFEKSTKWNSKGLTFFSTDNFLISQRNRIDDVKKNYR
jgi:tetratricopeptide (TPR) repeat protein